MELFLDFLKVLFRVFTILPLMLMLALYMGKRSIGELPVFDFLVIITLASVVGADIADPNIHHFHTVGAVIAIAILQKFIAWWKIKNRNVGRFLTFEPTLVIYNGQFHVENMRKISYSIDNILQMLRQKEVFHVSDVQFAFIEANGELSVKLKLEKEHARIEHMQLNPKNTGVEIPVIIDGKLYVEALEFQGLNEAWLREELLKRKIAKMSDVFYAAVNAQNKLHISLKEQTPPKSVPIFH
ncbi:MAG: DUF421 domain-containing protein [Bacillaceae bacterium]|nr:DUF421 domain-containing protein [Bacillaceae bacterium]